MKNTLIVILAAWLALMPVSFGNDNSFNAFKGFNPLLPPIFHCNGAPVVINPKGFWVLKDWQCPHYGLHYSRGFYSFGHNYSYSLYYYDPFWMYGMGLYPQSRYPHPYLYGMYPANPDVENEEPWYKFIQKYLKEHPEQTDKSNNPQKNQE